MSLGAGGRKRHARGGLLLYIEPSCGRAGFPLAVCESREPETLAAVWACCRGTSALSAHEYSEAGGGGSVCVNSCLKALTY